MKNKIYSLSCLILAFLLLVSGCRKKPTEVSYPLHEAAKAGDSERVKSLIANGADINSQDENDNTPLYFAAVRGYKTITEVLITNGADVGAKTNRGQTAMDFARSRKHKDIVDLLNAKTNDINSDKKR
jgi:ankyrin repeat protein